MYDHIIGYDIGTRFIKVCIIKKSTIVSFAVSRFGSEIDSAIDRTRKEAMKKANLHFWDIKGSASTGYGGSFIKNATVNIENDACIAKAAKTLNPESNTIIDVGALFIHVVNVDCNGRAIDSIKNEKCAAGSGKFLETITEALELSLEELTREVAKSQNPYKITNTCAVFAESEVISKVNQGKKREDILAGLIHSISAKITTMVKRIGIEGPVHITGGLGKIEIFRETLKQHLERDVVVLDCDYQIAAAYGAALIEEMRTQ